ncbi:MAG: V-type ATP synthase subunit D [Firmicutes bacterium]|nr:V-type ATP synthase subunit D [Bacillota bacterium]MBR6025782.1 V-type ATP synthase subunit D [Bacillota bacterium]
MANIKLTKNEQKVQKDRLKQFERYLPTLQLKKQQLQSVITQINADLEQKQSERDAMIQGLDDWIAVFVENTIFPEDLRLEKLVQPDKVIADKENIAGVAIPIFRELTFKDIVYDVADYPLWVDTAVIKLREIARLDALVKTLQTQVDMLGKELRTTSQRVNLFEKVKIPEAKENIRMIGIYLGDQQTSAVVRGKIAKKKSQEVQQQ